MLRVSYLPRPFAVRSIPPGGVIVVYLVMYRVWVSVMELIPSRKNYSFTSFVYVLRIPHRDATGKVFNA